jgi:hypothetical protein
MSDQENRWRAEFERLGEQQVYDNIKQGAIYNDERKRQKREAQERQAAAQEAVQLRYRSCVRSAENAYTISWAQECKRMVDRAVAKYKECVSEKPTEKNCCDTLYSERNGSPTNCSLPRLLGQDISDNLDKWRKRCLDESRAGLQ